MLIPVIRGKEAGRQTYVGKLTFRQFADAIDVAPSDVPSDQKLQRDLLATRTSAISSYLLNNPDSFLFPGVVAVVQSANYQPMGDAMPDIGTIDLPDGEFRYLADGQGRLSGIKKALTVDPSLGDNTVDVKFVVSAGLEHDQQIFADCNLNTTAVSKSMGIALDHRTVLHQIVKTTLNSNPELKGFIDYEKPGVNAKSDHLWSLAQCASLITKATGLTKPACEKKLSDPVARGKIVRFLNQLLSEWVERHELMAAVVIGELSPQVVKQKTIVGTAVFLEAFGVIARLLQFVIIETGEKHWHYLDGLSRVDFNRSNPEWIGRCIGLNGKMIKNNDSISATAAYIAMQCGLPVTADLKKANDKVIADRASLNGPQQGELNQCA